MRNLIVYSFALVCLLLTSTNLFAQDKPTKFSATYYSTNEFALSLFKNHKFYIEARFKPQGEINGSSSNVKSLQNHKIADANYSLLLKRDFNLLKNKVFLSTGIGLSFSDKYDDYLIVPVDFKLKNVLNTNYLSLSAGIDLRNTGSSYEFLPKLGVSINF